MTGSPSWSRRKFLSVGTSATAVAGFAPSFAFAYQPKPFRAIQDVEQRHRERLDSTLVQRVVFAAVESARKLGATYADARITRTITQGFRGTTFNIFDSEEISLGVRVLVRGAWGFSTSPLLTEQEAGRLARLATEQATYNAIATEEQIVLGTYPPVSGHWETPLRVDPFSISIEEKNDMLRGWVNDAASYRYTVAPLLPEMMFTRQERALATSDGTFVTQTTLQSAGDFGVAVGDGRRIPIGMRAKKLVRSGKGWELFLDAKLRDQLPALVEEGDLRLFLKRKPVNIGRYDVVLDGATAASLLDKTLGASTELDRALGYEANAEGTSYLGPDPLALLGKFSVASPLMTVIANRSQPGGLATVQWDDEGIRPADFAVVERGVLTGYQTTREQAAWLAPWYESRGHAAMSSGCAGAESASFETIQRAPNFQVQPSATNQTFGGLVAAVDHGYAVMEGEAIFDFQSRHGTIRGHVREIVNGKLGDAILGSGMLFTSLDWKNVTAIGGAGTEETIAASRRKGQPEQTCHHSVTAVPLRLQNATMIDMMRKG